MSVDVFANNMEVSCKAGDSQVTAAFPDVCLSPPPPPAGPQPLPYPVSSSSGDMTDGSKSVRIGRKEVMLRDKSYFKKCTGDEAATKSLGQGVANHALGGKVYFISWSDDVEIEGECVVRHLDMTTSNHASPMANDSVPWVNTASQAFEAGGVCEGMSDDLRLQPYSKDCPEKNGKRQTGHHLIPGRCLRDAALVNIPGYNHQHAPVICVSFGNQHQGSHERCHALFDPVELRHFEMQQPFTYEAARTAAVDSVEGALDPARHLSDPEKKCVAFQLDEYYTKKPPTGPGQPGSQPLRASDRPGKVNSTRSIQDLLAL